MHVDHGHMRRTITPRLDRLRTGWSPSCLGDPEQAPPDAEPGSASRRPAPAGSDGAGAGRTSQPPGPEPIRTSRIYDSCLDDLNLILSQPFPSRTRHCDRSRRRTTDRARLARRSPVPSFLQERGKQPRTSEIFKAVGPQAGERPTRRRPRRRGIVTRRRLAGCRDRVRAGLAERRTSGRASSGQAPRIGVDDDDQLAESRMPWCLSCCSELLERGHAGTDLGPLDGPIVPARRATRGRHASGELRIGSEVVEPSPAERAAADPGRERRDLGKTIRIGDAGSHAAGDRRSPRWSWFASIEPAD